MKITFRQVRDEVSRLANSLREMIERDEVTVSSVKSIVSRIDRQLFPIVDRCKHTEFRREMMEDLDRVQYAAERVLEGCDLVELDLYEGTLQEALLTLSEVGSNYSTRRVHQLVSEELARAGHLIEAPEVLPGDVQKLANDSVDVALDSYFKKVGETLDATGNANLEKAEDGEGDQKFSVVDFASDVANLVDRSQKLLDLDGTIARRAYNHVAEKFGPDAAENLKQVLSANFDIDLESRFDQEAEREGDRPAAAGAGGGAVAAAAGGGGGAGA